MAASSQIQEIIDLLIRSGFEETNSRKTPETDADLAVAEPSAGAAFKKRFYLHVRTNWRVTIGKRMVSFYELINHVPNKFHDFELSDFTGIKKFLKKYF